MKPTLVRERDWIKAGQWRAQRAKFLFVSQENGLAFSPEPRVDLQPGGRVFTLHGVVEHDVFLLKALKREIK